MTQRPIWYVLDSVGQHGGSKMICEHVSRLATRGLPASILYSADGPTWFSRPINAVRIRLPTDLIHVRGIKVATACYTANWVADSLHKSDSAAYFVQDFDEEIYHGIPRALTYDLGLQTITEGEWVTSQLATRFGVMSDNVGIGIDFETFHPQPANCDPLRIFTQYRPGAGPDDLKGWSLALETVSVVREQLSGVSLVTFGIGTSPVVPSGLPHIHVQRPTDEHLRRIYCESGLFLLTSRHEGFGLTAAEAMACECPVVATYANGNEEFCRNDETCLMGRTADELASQCVKLLQLAVLRERLVRSARLFVESRYQWDSVIDRLEAFYARIP